MSYISNGGGGGTGGAGSNAILLKDSDGVIWDLEVNASGNLVTTSLGPQALTPQPIILIDSTNAQWALTVLPTGNLDTEPVP